MSEAIFEGDEWKHVREPATVPCRLIPVKKFTRAEAQVRLDDLYAAGKITLDQWRDRTDLLSEPLFKNFGSLLVT